jgi:undecaprenyl-diphosphatase
VDILIVILLALVQALTEFLPISSSGHLALAGFFFGWDYQGLVMDLAVHLGTLVAVVLYFRDELLHLARELLAMRPGRALSAEQRLGIGIGLATVPAALVGVSMSDAFAESLRHPLLIAATTAGFALLLWWADARRRGTRDEYAIGIGGALFAGAMQALALVPGVSRSGITMTAALMMGLSRTAAARYSFLMSIPITALATAHGVKEVVTGESTVVGETFLAAAVLSGVFAFIVIHFFLRFVQAIGALPFVVYRLLFAAVVVALWFGR